MHASIQLYEPNSSRRIGPQTGRVPAEASTWSPCTRGHALWAGACALAQHQCVHVLEWHCLQTRDDERAQVYPCVNETLYEVAKYTESTNVLDYPCARIVRVSSVGRHRSVQELSSQLLRHQKFDRPRTGPVVVQFTIEACALCPDGDAQDRA